MKTFEAKPESLRKDNSAASLKAAREIQNQSNVYEKDKTNYHKDGGTYNVMFNKNTSNVDLAVRKEIKDEYNK